MIGSFCKKVDVNMKKVSKSTVTSLIAVMSMNVLFLLILTFPILQFYFFEFACGVSGYLLGVNPFNQPGVESYKKNMFALLGKPGYEEQREELLKRL